MLTVNFTENRQRFLNIVNEVLPGSHTITRKQIVAIVRGSHVGQTRWPAWLTDDKSLRAGRGEYTLPSLVRRIPLVKIDSLDGLGVVAPVADATSEPVSAS